MENKLIRNYEQPLNLKEIQKVQLLFEKLFIANLINNFNILEVRSPLIFNENLNTDTFELAESRAINFDSSTNEGVFTIYNRYVYWLLNTINKLAIKNNNGILTHAHFINRDKENTNHSSMEENQLIIEYRYDNETDILQKILKTARLIFNIIINTKREIIPLFKAVPHIAKDNLDIIDLDLHHSKYKTFSMEEVEKELAQAKGSVLLLNVLTLENEIIDDSAEEYLRVITYNENSTQAYKLFNASIRKTLEDLKRESEASENYKEEYNFIKHFVSKEYPRTFNITIDLDNVLLFVMGLGHKAELQSSSEIGVIEKILKEKKIIHL